MLLPYRAKNPPEHFPYVTIGLIVINTLIFAVTVDEHLTIRESVIEEYALSMNTLSPLRMLTSMFLHGGILHLVGNMLALWLFGASVEGRLRPAKFLALYFVAGITGDVAHLMTFGAAQPEQFALGASGAIMGLTGAYL